MKSKGTHPLAGGVRLLGVGQHACAVPGGRMHTLYVRRDARRYGPGSCARMRLKISSQSKFLACCLPSD